VDEIDRKLLAEIQEEFPLVEEPFKALAEKLGIPGSEVRSRLTSLQEQGLIRRIGPVLDLRKLGRRGVLVAVKIPEDEAYEVAKIVNNYREVSHNYLRPNETGYNLWFTVSADEGRIEEIIRDVLSRTGCKILVLPTLRIFKIGVKFDVY
jgi:DNA-binding Lrp family transcriptional regulator